MSHSTHVGFSGPPAVLSWMLTTDARAGVRRSGSDGQSKFEFLVGVGFFQTAVASPSPLFDEAPALL